MKIGIEAQRIFRKNKHGMDYVVLQEIIELQKMDTKNEYFVFVAPGPDRCLDDSRNVHIIEVNGSFYPTWEQKALSKAAREAGVELLHCTSNTAPIRCDIPLILTLHDIIFLEPRDKHNRSLYQNLGWLYRRLVVPRILGKCRRIITVSEFEKQNIVSRLNIPDHRMAMIYNGYNDWFRPLDDTEGVYTKYIANPGFLFFLGNTDPKKNTERTLIAYSRYLERSAVRRPLFMADLDQHFLNDIISRNQLDNIRDNIVITKNGGPKEYYDKGYVQLVNPYDIDDIGKAVLKAMEDDTSQPKLREKLLQEYDVKRCVDKLIDAYQKIL